MSKHTWFVIVPLVQLFCTRADAATMRSETARRFLRTFGYADALSGERVDLPNGRSTALSSIKTHEALLRLTLQLGSPKAFAGVGGLSSKKPEMQNLLAA